MLLSLCCRHAATWQKCHSNKTTAIVTGSLHRGNTYMSLFFLSYSSDKPLFDPAGSIGPPMDLFVCAVLSQRFQHLLCFSFLWISFPVRGCTYVDDTHLHCKKTICIRENAIGVNMALESSKTKPQCY